MDEYQKNMSEEIQYLDETLSFIAELIRAETEDLDTRKGKLIEARRTMWQESAHSSRDFARLTEMNQYLTEVLNQTASYSSTAKQLEKYRKMLRSPYFGRFDFAEEGFDTVEKIYIGLYSIIDPKSHDIYVYDWRAPISGIFYRFELGEAFYEAPSERVTGEVVLKRQYKIQDSKMKYFFDCSITIDDEMLQEVLSHNTSPKMRNIVETIQKEQDMIIRDTESELLIAQGVAGSGKTSIALHRIAFLLYHGLSSGVTSKNILIVSPNDIFSSYISNVLPELGEENVEQITFDDVAEKVLGKDLNLQSRSMMLEHMIRNQRGAPAELEKQSLGFKGSRKFARIIERFMSYYAKRMVEFTDVYYHGRVVESKHKLKSFFLNNRVNMPMAQKLKRIEMMIFDKIHPLQKERIKKIEKLVQGLEGHDFDIKPFSRLMSLKETKALTDNIHRFTEVDCFRVYKALFDKPDIFYKMSEGMELPENIEEILCETKHNLNNGVIKYEDVAPLILLKLKLEGGEPYTEKRQVVIDEAQDYYPMQYEIFKLLFPYASYTIVGDVHQSIEREAGLSIYDEITDILNKKKSARLFLNKSYRSSYEINLLTRKLLDIGQDFVSFERHECQPALIEKENEQSVYKAMAESVAAYLGEGYESLAVICKTLEQAEKVFAELGKHIKVSLLGQQGSELHKGVLVIPAHLAKGMEFDGVLVYDVSANNYSTDLDRKLLYIACTRALHRLSLYYAGDICEFLRF